MGLPRRRRLQHDHDPRGLTDGVGTRTGPGSVTTIDRANTFHEERLGFAVVVDIRQRDDSWFVETTPLGFVCPLALVAGLHGRPTHRATDCRGDDCLRPRDRRRPWRARRLCGRSWSPWDRLLDAPRQPPPCWRGVCACRGLIDERPRREFMCLGHRSRWPRRSVEYAMVRRRGVASAVMPPAQHDSRPRS